MKKKSVDLAKGSTATEIYAKADRTKGSARDHLLTAKEVQTPISAVCEIVDDAGSAGASKVAILESPNVHGGVGLQVINNGDFFTEDEMEGYLNNYRFHLDSSNTDASLFGKGSKSAQLKLAKCKVQNLPLHMNQNTLSQVDITIASRGINIDGNDVVNSMIFHVSDDSSNSFLNPDGVFVEDANSSRIKNTYEQENTLMGNQWTTYRIPHSEPMPPAKQLMSNLGIIYSEAIRKGLELTYNGCKVHSIDIFYTQALLDYLNLDDIREIPNGVYRCPINGFIYVIKKIHAKCIIPNTKKQLTATMILVYIPDMYWDKNCAKVEFQVPTTQGKTKTETYVDDKNFKDKNGLGICVGDRIILTRDNRLMSFVDVFGNKGAKNIQGGAGRQRMLLILDDKNDMVDFGITSHKNNGISINFLENDTINRYYVSTDKEDMYKRADGKMIGKSVAEIIYDAAVVLKNFYRFESIYIGRNNFKLGRLINQTIAEEIYSHKKTVSQMIAEYPSRVINGDLDDIIDNEELREHLINLPTSAPEKSPESEAIEEAKEVLNITYKNWCHTYLPSAYSDSTKIRYSEARLLKNVFAVLLGGKYISNPDTGLEILEKIIEVTYPNS